MSKFVVHDIEENEYFCCKDLEEAETTVEEIKKSIFDYWEGGVEYREHINVYKLIETVSFVKDERTTEEINKELAKIYSTFGIVHREEIGKWEYEKEEE